MAGINRLGKAKPKPGSLRAPDPNKYRTFDFLSEDGKEDADYMRMVHDIEDAQQSQVGWLFGRGAFDKGDLLYLRDEEEKKRHAELELRDSERSQFAVMRAKAEAFDGGGPSLELPKIAKKDRPSLLPKPTIIAKPAGKPGLPTVKVKPVGGAKAAADGGEKPLQKPLQGSGQPSTSGQGSGSQGGNTTQEAQQPNVKRQRLGNEGQGEAGGSRSAGDVNQAGSASKGEDTNQGGEDSDDEGGGNALLGLLGAYGGDASGSDSEQ